jgi:hypothetical protein
LEGGNLTVGGYENIGNSGIGSFTQIGGIHTVNPQNTINGGLNLGLAGNSSGTYDLMGGLLSVGGAESIGFSGTGSFIQSGGNHTTGNLLLGGNGGSGTYNLNKGNLSVNSSEFIGNSGSGIFNQSGGNHTVANTLSLADVAGSSGTYNLSGGILSAANEFIAHGLAGGSTGTFNQSGGVHKVSGNLSVGSTTKSTPQGLGAYNLNGGKLKAAYETIGDSGIGVFTQTGGINTVTHTLTLSAGNGSGTYNYLGGLLSTGAIQINAGGTFNIKGISRTITSNVVNSGTVKTTNANVIWNGTFTNNGAYISDPSKQTFNQDLMVGTNGYLVGLTSQDLFVVKNDFISQSINSSQWNTVQAELKFATGLDNSHDFSINGVVNPVDERTPPANNFSWYSLDITRQTIHLIDGDTSNASTALYVGKMLGAIINGNNQVTNIVGGPDADHPIYIYFDPALNPNLGMNDYLFAKGYGALKWDPEAPVPLPTSLYLLGSGLMGLGLLGWRRKRLMD